MSDILPIKLQLERRLSAELLRFFRDYLIDWAKTDGLVPRERWLRVLAEMLASHYASATRSVHAGRVIRTDETLADILGPIESQRLIGRALDQARMIMSTVDRDLVESTVSIKSLQLTRKDKNPFSVYIVGQLRTVWEKLKRRVRTIANMNTQEPSESAAHRFPQTGIIEDSGLVDVVGNADSRREQLYVRWVTRLDERVRGAPGGKYASSQFNHWEAHGQIVPIGTPFTVSGEQLRFPGDTTLGASVGNVINCRCGTESGVMRNGEFIPIDRIQGAEARPTNPKFEDPRPTSMFTFGTGRNPTRATIILGNGQRANVTASGGGITIRVNRKPVASAQITRDSTGNMRLGSVTVDPRYQGQGIESMLSRSVEASNRLNSN